MKFRRALLTLAILPLGLFAQTGATTGSPQAGGTGTTAEPSATFGIVRAEVRRVTEDSVKDQLSAKFLIGKPVHDTQGRKIGSVRDILLGDERAGFAAYQSGAASSSDWNQHPPASANDSATSRDSASENRSPPMAEPAAIISAGGFAGLGDILLRVPLSQLSYDVSRKRLTLALSEAELNQLKDAGNRYPDTAN